MYGTVARLRVKPGMEAEFEHISREMEEAFSPPGFVATSVYRMDHDPTEYIMVVAFEDKDSYVANADDPRTHTQYLKLLEVLAGEPEWNDGEIVYAKW